MIDVPDGMFFKVVPEDFGFISVQLREPRKRFGSRLVSSSLVHPGEFESGVAAVEFGKHRAVEKWHDAVQAWQNYRDALEAGK